MDGLDEAIARLRKWCIEADNLTADMQEAAFNQWREGTLFPDAVNRLVAEIGEAV